MAAPLQRQTHTFSNLQVPNDERLAKECPELDLILGGHDHDAYRAVVNGDLGPRRCLPGAHAMGGAAQVFADTAC